jgi:hypothetical protein
LPVISEEDGHSLYLPDMSSFSGGGELFIDLVVDDSYDRKPLD